MNNYSNKKIITKKKLKPSVKSFINRLLITTIIFLSVLIICKKDLNIKKNITKYVYNDSINFIKFKKIYEKYFGKILSSDKVIPTEESVFSEKLNYKKKNVYKDGVMLAVDNNYLVPVIESGIVVFMGEKEDYGYTIIIQQVNGIDTWYCNINAKDIKMYDYVKKGQLLGEVKTTKLYLVFQKEGKFLDYKKYI